MFVRAETFARVATSAIVSMMVAGVMLGTAASVVPVA